MKKINVMAMAGSGQRFLDQNYKTPKPLIIIKKKPMFYHAVKSLPSSQKIIFIYQKKLSFIYKIKFFVKKFFKNSRIIEIKKKQTDKLLLVNWHQNILIMMTLLLMRLVIFFLILIENNLMN